MKKKDEEYQVLQAQVAALTEAVAKLTRRLENPTADPPKETIPRDKSLPVFIPVKSDVEARFRWQINPNWDITVLRGDLYWPINADHEFLQSLIFLKVHTLVKNGKPMAEDSLGRVGTWVNLLPNRAWRMACWTVLLSGADAGPTGPGWQSFKGFFDQFRKFCAGDGMVYLYV